MVPSIYSLCDTAKGWGSKPQVRIDIRPEDRVRLNLPRLTFGLTKALVCFPRKWLGSPYSGRAISNIKLSSESCRVIKINGLCGKIAGLHEWFRTQNSDWSVL